MFYLFHPQLFDLINELFSPNLTLEQTAQLLSDDLDAFIKQEELGEVNEGYSKQVFKEEFEHFKSQIPERCWPKHLDFLDKSYPKGFYASMQEIWQSLMDPEYRPF